MKKLVLIPALFAAATVGTAFAQNVPQDPDPSENTQDGQKATEESTDDAPVNDGTLPTPTSDNDPHPEVASPGMPAGGLVEQAGIGGRVGYGRAGVLELGGSAGLTAATDLTQVNVAPSIGWFVADNLELTGIVDLAYAKTGDTDGMITTLLVEPSYHLPFNRTTFGFLGMGVGAIYVKGPGLGFAIAPRVGANLMVGRSGILTPSLSWQYTTHDTMDVATGSGTQGQLLVVSSALRAQVGYTVMW
jgi:hypothetical protein